MTRQHAEAAKLQLNVRIKLFLFLCLTPDLFNHEVLATHTITGCTDPTTRKKCIENPVSHVWLLFFVIHYQGVVTE